VKKIIKSIPLIILFSAGILALIDQLTKAAAAGNLSPVSPVVMIDNFFHLILVKNRGAAFGIMSDLQDPARSIIFGIISIFAFVVLIYIYGTRPAGSRLTPISIALILGGAIGNIIDRVRLGYVIDFLDFHIKGYHWPTFNFADSCITVGVSLMLLQMLLEEWRRHAP